jgi:virginiamycin B lyase
MWSRSKCVVGGVARPQWRAGWLMISLLAVAPMSVAQPTIETHVYPLPVNKTALKLTEGPDGAMWFTTGCFNPCPSSYHPTIGRITRDGVITEYELPSAIPAPDYGPYGITSGPDGALWFAENRAQKIGRITTTGEVTEYPLPSPENPQEITVGPDGALWFTEPNPGGFGIGRISITGAATLYPLGTSSDPEDLVAGPDGALWFTELNGFNSIGRATTGGLVTFFPQPGACSTTLGIAAGSDGALWFTCFTSSSIGRITTSGAATTYSTPTPNSQPVYIAAGPDGALWFSEQNGCKLGRVTTTGVVTEYSGLFACGEIAAGLGGLWTNYPAGSITYITVISQDSTPPLITPQVTGTLGSNGWYRSNVTVNWNVADPESGIAASSGCGATTLTADTPGVTLTCSATNGAGLSASKAITIKIDQTPPVLSGMPGPGCSIWPPNHKMVQVATVTAADALSGIAGGSFNVTGSSNEPPSGPQISIVQRGGAFTVALLAERSSDGTGRVYSLRAAASDQADNTATVNATCTVPHDQRN